MLQLTDGGLVREDTQDVKAQGGCEFKAREHQYFLPQAAIFLEPFFLLREEAIQFLQRLQFLDLGQHPRIAGNGVVVGEGDDLQVLSLRFVENIQIGNARLLVVR